LSGVVTTHNGFAKPSSLLPHVLCERDATNKQLRMSTTSDFIGRKKDFLNILLMKTIFLLFLLLFFFHSVMSESCLQVTPEECSMVGGQFKNFFTPCDEAQCPLPTLVHNRDDCHMDLDDNYKPDGYCLSCYMGLSC